MFRGAEQSRRGMHRECLWNAARFSLEPSDVLFPARVVVPSSPFLTTVSNRKQRVGQRIAITRRSYLARDRSRLVNTRDCDCDFINIKCVIRSLEGTRKLMRTISINLYTHLYFAIKSNVSRVRIAPAGCYFYFHSPPMGMLFSKRAIFILFTDHDTTRFVRNDVSANILRTCRRATRSRTYVSPKEQI